MPTTSPGDEGRRTSTGRRWGAFAAALAVAAAGVAFAVHERSGPALSAGRGGGGGIAFVKAGPKMGPGVDSTDIYLLGYDGRVQNLTDDAAAESSPAWSRDGSRVAFIRTSYTRGQLHAGVYVMNGDGTGMRVIRPCPGERCELRDLSWSPDGTRIAFVDYASHGHTPFEALGVCPGAPVVEPENAPRTPPLLTSPCPSTAGHLLALSRSPLGGVKEAVLLAAAAALVLGGLALAWRIR